MLASRACHGYSQASDLSRQGAGQRQSGHLAFQWRLDPLLELPHRNLDFKSNDEGLKASTVGRAHQVVSVSVLPRSCAESVQQLSAGSRQALSAKVDPKL